MHLIGQELAGLHGFLRDLQERFVLQRVVEGLICGQHDLLLGGYGILIRGFSLKLLVGDQVLRPAKISDQLAQGRATGSP